MSITTADAPTARPYLSLVLTAAVVIGSPGPVTIGATASATAFGLRRSLPFLAGSIAGTGGVLVAATAGLASLLLAVPHLGPMLLGLSVGYLIYLAYRIAAAAPLTVPDTRARAPSWSTGFVLAVTNPKAYAAFGSLLGGTLGLPTGTVDTLVTTSTLAVLIVLSHLAWAVAGATFATALRHPRTSRAVNIVLAAALIAATVPVLTELLP